MLLAGFPFGYLSRHEQEASFAFRVFRHFLVGHLQVVFGGLECLEDVRYNANAFCDVVFRGGFDMQRYLEHLIAQHKLRDACYDLVTAIQAP